MGKEKKSLIRSGAAEYLTYIASVGNEENFVELRYEEENIWLTQKAMAKLYDMDVRTINHHIQKVFKDNELLPEATIRKYEIVQEEGKREVRRNVSHYKMYLLPMLDVTHAPRRRPLRSADRFLRSPRISFPPTAGARRFPGECSSGRSRRCARD